MRGWLQNTTIDGCLPVGSSSFSKVNGQRVLAGPKAVVRKKTADRSTALLYDEWTERGVPVLGIIAHVGGCLKFCVDVAFLEGKSPKRGVEHKEIAGALLSSLADAHIHPERINFVISDEGSTVVAAAKHVLQHTWRNARWFLFWSHKLANIGDIMKKHDVLEMINLGWACWATAFKSRPRPKRKDQTQLNMTHTQIRLFCRIFYRIFPHSFRIFFEGQ